MRKQLLILLSLVLISTFISAAQTQTNINSNQGYEVFYPQLDYLPQYSNLSYHIHLTNISNAYPLPNTAADCYLHAYNKSLDHTFESKKLNLDPNGFDYDINLNYGNFTSLGTHSIYVYCNNSAANLGGEAKIYYEVTPNGEPNANGIFSVFIYILFIVAVIGLISTFILTLVKLATSNETIFGILTTWAFYILMIITDFLAKNYYNNAFLSNNTAFFLTITVWTNAVLPLISLFITFFIKGTQKKKPLGVEELTGRSPYG